jgi:hypothetical protein
VASGIEVVVTVMTVHKTIAGVQEQACRALMNLAGNPDNRDAIMIGDRDQCV